MATVERDDEGLYVEVDGVRYRSEDLPEAGTDVDVSTFTWVGDSPGADVTWTNESPSGMGFARCHGWWS